MAITAYHAGKPLPKRPDDETNQPKPGEPVTPKQSAAPGFITRTIDVPKPTTWDPKNPPKPIVAQKHSGGNFSHRRFDRNKKPNQQGAHPNNRPRPNNGGYQPQSQSNQPKSMFQTVDSAGMPKIERPRPPKKRMQQRAETPGILLQPTATETVARSYQASQKKLRIIPLGGLGEIGKNMTAIEYGDDIITIDCGAMFPTEEMPGIDLVIPDVTYLIENKHKLRGMFFTHGHEDHISGTAYVLPRLGNVPLYALPLTASFIEGKLVEFNNLTKVNVIKTGQVIRAGVFTIEAFSITHSIPDSVGFAITTPEGTIVYTTDWKFDHTPIWGEPTNFAKIMELGKQGVLLLTSDSTNASEPGYTISERIIGERIDEIFDRKKGRIIVTTFSSLINRVQMVVNSAAKHGRKVALLGRSMENNVKRAHELGYFDAPKDVIVDKREIGKIPDDKLTILCTGSQGEEYSALVRMASGEHRDVQLKVGDSIIISASEIPGNEHAIHTTIDNLFRQGADVLYGEELDFHESGHAKGEELKMMISLIKPKYFMPIHGDYRLLKSHAKLATEVGIDPKNIFVAENGSVIEIDKGNGTWGKPVPGGYVFVDGLGIGDIGQIVLRDRKAMAEEGIFVVIMTVDSKTGQLVGSPDIISRGFVYMRAAENLMFKARNEIKVIFAKHAKEKGTMDWEFVKHAIRDELNDFLYEYTQRQPMVIPVIIEV